MGNKIVRQHGLWSSSISAKMMAGGRRLSEVQWDSDGETLVWLEGRSDQSVLVAANVVDGQAPRDLTSGINVRAKVGYGGGDFTVARGCVYFADAESGRLFRLSLGGGQPQPITPPFGSAASPRVSPDGRFVAYVHHDQDHVDRLAVVDSDGKSWPQILVSGHDFYTQFRWSPDGRHCAFVAWNHPHMPWEGSSLYLVPVQGASGLPTLGKIQRVAGGEATAVFQPEFTADGRSLVFVSDESGWSHLHLYDLASGKSRQVTRGEGTEYGLPNWIQEMRTYALSNDGRFALAIANKRGFAKFEKIDLATGKGSAIEALAAYTEIAQPALSPKRDDLAFIASSPLLPSRLVSYDLNRDVARVMARATTESVVADELSQPEPITWRSAGEEEAHGLYYPPVNPHFEAPGKAPLMVFVHGGPTSQVRAGFRMEAQFLTSRGYAVLYVNHRGSTGYGRAYMLKHHGTWGLVDVQDSVTGARHLAAAGKVDPERMVISGGSAGGYTVLQTMVDEPTAFAAGISLYGISNQFALVAATHKFEERYSDWLLGPLPEAAKLYRERSPLLHADKIRRPLAVFQGSKDTVVPRDQSDAIVNALKRTGTPCFYQVYEGEGHGFRKSENIEHYYNSVDAFLKEHVIYK